MTWINCSSKQNKERDICRFRKSLRGRYAYLVKDIKIPKNAGFWATIPVEKKVTVEVDANTAEVVSTSQSWWAFLSTDAGGDFAVSISVTNMNGQTTTETKTCPGDCTTIINTYYVSKNNPIAKSNNHGIIDRNQYVPKYKI